MNSVLFIILSFVWGIGATYPPVPDHPAVVQDEMQNPVNVLMKDLSRYYVAIFWKGPNWKSGSESILEARAKESKELKKLVKSGKLVGVVRTTGDADCKLLAFFKTDSKDEAWAIADSVLAVKEKVLTPELYHIWGTRGMGKELRTQMDDGKTSPKRQAYYLGLFKKGKNWKADAPEDSMHAWASRHAGAVLKWKSSGELRFYGAVDDAGPLRVMGIFSATSLDDAKQKLGASPSVKGEWFTSETYSCTVLDGILP